MSLAPGRGRTTSIATVLALIAAIGLLDFSTGPNVSFAVFYLMPIALAAWVLGRRFGYWATFLATCTMFGIEAWTGIAPPAVLAWNAVVRASIFVLFALVLARLRGSALHLQAEVERQTALLNEVAENTAREQARVARDLHDGIGQYLSGLALRTRMLADDLQADGSARAADARRLYDVVQKVARECRRVDHFLRGVRASDEDLFGALRRLATKTEELFNVKCGLTLPQTSPSLEPLQADMLFHIAQEALNNALKHADGAGMRVDVVHQSGWLQLLVADTGPGLPSQSEAFTGIGLRTMRQRAELIGAEFALSSGPGERGVVVTCTLRLASNAAR